MGCNPTRVTALRAGGFELSSGTPNLVWADNMIRGEMRHAMRIVIEQQAFLLRRWEDIHGRAG